MQDYSSEQATCLIPRQGNCPNHRPSILLGFSYCLLALIQLITASRQEIHHLSWFGDLKLSVFVNWWKPIKNFIPSNGSIKTTTYRHEVYGEKYINDKFSWHILCCAVLENSNVLSQEIGPLFCAPFHSLFFVFT